MDDLSLSKSNTSYVETNWSAVFAALAKAQYNEKLNEALLGEIWRSSFENDSIFVCQKLKEVSFGNKKIDLHTKPFLVRLFYLFSQSPNAEISKKQLIELVYHVPFNVEEISERRYSSLSHNVVKLISRGRIIAQKNFSDQNEKYSLEWFPHNSETESWSLYRVKLNHQRK